LYANGVPMDEAQLQAAFAAYHAELDELPPPAECNQWQTAQQIAASQRLAVITGTHPHSPVFLVGAERRLAAGSLMVFRMLVV
jgi:hypothetical protein